MKRLPIVLSLLAVIALSASIAYWVMELYKPVQRPMAAVAEAPMADPDQNAAATLFGGQVLTAAASNYQLTGVVAAGRDSVAILVADGQPPRALMVGREIVSGVVVKEVHPKYVMLSEGGVLKRIDLATDGKGGNAALAAPVAGADQYQQQLLQQQQQQAQQPPPPPEAPGASVPVPGNQPMEVPAQPPGMPAPPPPAVQMPAPTKNMSGQGGQQPPTQ
ncbi:MAG: type II secretion system protein N [Pseudomonadota bacterium]